MWWCFAIINNRLAEIYFNKKRGKTRILAHCYIKKDEYTTEEEKRWIEEDISKFKFSYRKNNYSRLES